MFHKALQGDTDAAKAFAGETPEIMNNKFYQNQQIDIKLGTYRLLGVGAVVAVKMFFNNGYKIFS